MNLSHFAAVGRFAYDSVSQSSDVPTTNTKATSPPTKNWYHGLHCEASIRKDASEKVKLLDLMLHQTVC
eukprot:5739353-Amphidinium_carterae.1